MLKFAYLKVKEWVVLLLLGLGVVVGYFAFIKKQDIELPERPKDLELDIPDRPKEKDHRNTLADRLEKIRKDQKKIKKRSSRVKELNKNAEERTKK